MNVSEWCTLSSVTNTTPSWCNMLPSAWLSTPTYCNRVLRWFVRQPDPQNIPRYTEKQQSPYKLTFATLHETMKNLQDECSIWRKVSNFKPQKKNTPSLDNDGLGLGDLHAFLCKLVALFIVPSDTVNSGYLVPGMLVRKRAQTSHKTFSSYTYSRPKRKKQWDETTCMWKPRENPKILKEKKGFAASCDQSVYRHLPFFLFAIFPALARRSWWVFS